MDCKDGIYSYILMNIRFIIKKFEQRGMDCPPGKMHPKHAKLTTIACILKLQPASKQRSIKVQFVLNQTD